MGKICFSTIVSLLREPILHITTIKTADRRVFKMATGCSKWLPAMLRDEFLAIQAPKMAGVWRNFAGWCVFSPLECINRFLMCFIGFFIFALRRFCSTVILLERINVVKQGTTVVFFKAMIARKLIAKYLSLPFHTGTSGSSTRSQLKGKML